MSRRLFCGFLKYFDKPIEAAVIRIRSGKTVSRKKKKQIEKMQSRKTTAEIIKMHKRREIGNDLCSS